MTTRLVSQYKTFVVRAKRAVLVMAEIKAVTASADLDRAAIVAAFVTSADVGSTSRKPSR